MKRRLYLQWQRMLFLHDHFRIVHSTLLIVYNIENLTEKQEKYETVAEAFAND